MATVTLNQPGEDVTVGGSDVLVNGTNSGGEEITVVSGNIRLNTSFTQGGDTIILPGDAAEYSAYSIGAEVYLVRDDGLVSVRIPTGANGNEIRFDNGDQRTLVFDSTDGRFELEGQAISNNRNAPTDITPAGPPPLVGYDVVGSNTAVVEGDAGTRAMVFTITLDRPVTAADGPVTLNYVTQDGSADSASDYVAAAGQVVFGVGQQTATVTIQVVGDTVPESSETLQLLLTGAQLRNGPEQLTGTIANDDAAVGLTSKADNLVGSAGDDGWYAANGDLGAGDKITDPSTTDHDTLSLSVDQAYAQQTKGDTVYAGFTLTNVERIEVTNDSGEQVSLDLSGATGVETVASINSSDSVLFDQLTSLADVELNNLTDVNKGDVEARYQAAVLAGANTAVNVNVINTNVDDVTLGGIGGDKVGVEIVNLNVTGNSTIDTLVNNSLRDLNITGTGSVVIDDVLSSSVRNIDATGTAGSLDIDFSANDGAANVVFKGAQGANIVAAGTASDSITTYGGDDVVNDEGGNNTINVGEGNNVVNSGAGADTITSGAGNDVINAGDGANTVNAGDGTNVVTVGTGTDSVTTGSGADVVVDAGGDGFISTGGDTDTIVINGAGRTTIVAGSGDDVVDFNTDFDASSDGFGPRDNVDMGDGTDELRINAGAVDAQFRNVSSAEILTLETAGTTVLNNGVGGNGDSFAQAAGIQTINLNAGNDVVDAGDFTSGLTINSRGAGTGGDDNVTTGVGNDTFNMFGNLTGADVLNAGGGNGDRLILDGTTKFETAQFSGFETIVLQSSRDGSGTPGGNQYEFGRPDFTFGFDLIGGLTDANAPTNGLLTIDGSALQADTDGGGPLQDEYLMLDTNLVTTYDLNIKSGAADDILTIGSTNHTIDTGAGDDFVYQSGVLGFSGDNVVSLGDGDDQFDVSQGGGTNTVFGGNGVDYIAVRTNGGQEIIDAGADNDVIRFAQNGVATILGSEGDSVDGGDGFDYAYFQGSGTYGPDSFANVTNVEALIAGDGGDKSTYVLGAAGEAAGIRTIYDADAFGGVYGASTYDASAYSDGVTFDFEGVTVDFGRIGPQTFEGGGNDTAIGGAGDDRVILGAVGNVNLILNDGDDTVEAEGTELTYADKINGGAGDDTVLLDNTGGQVNAQVDLDVVTGVENFTIKSSGERFPFSGDNDANSITFRDGNVGSLTTINVDASALTDQDDTFTATIEASVDQEFQFNVTGSSTRDVLVRNQTFGAANNNITFNAGAGNDEFHIGALDLGGIINYDGGDGVDTLFQLSDLGTIQDDDFVGIRNVEILTGDVVLGDGIDAVLGAAAADSGLQTVRGTTGSDDVRLDAGFDAAALEVILGGGGSDVFRAEATKTAVTFQATASELTAGDDLRGGSTANDVLNIAAGGTSNANNVLGVETINVNGDGFGGVAQPSTLTLDTTAAQVTGGTVTVNAVGFFDAGDTFTLNGGAATARLVVNSGAGSDAITTGTGNDVIDAGNGNNTVTSDGGDDTITTGSGIDTINSGSGNDIVNSGGGADSIVAGDGNDTVNAGSGNDTVRGQIGNDTLNGDAGDDTLYGDFAYADFGSTAAYNASVGGNDTINGGSGNDTIVGGLLGDVLTGGDGADTFLYQTRDDSRVFAGGIDNRDIITDFVSGVDKINLLTLPEAAGQTVRFNGNWDTFGEGQGAITGTGGDGFLDVVFVRETDTLWIDIDNNGQLNGEDMQIILQGVDNLVAADVNNPHLVTGPVQTTMQFEHVQSMISPEGSAMSGPGDFSTAFDSSQRLMGAENLAWHHTAFA